MLSSNGFASFIYVDIFFAFRVTSSLPVGNCMYESKVMCCDDFEERNNACIECENGTTTKSKGLQCSPCDENMYGKKCAFECKCLKNQTCDNKIGCTGLPSILTTSSTIELGLDSEPTTQTVFKDKSSDTELKRADSNDTNQALHYVYGTIIGILLVINILSLACIVVFKRLNGRRITEFLGTLSQGNEYNYIDENMLDIVVPQSVNNAMISTNVSAISRQNGVHLTTIERISSSVDDDGYLIPRQPVAVNIWIHNYACSDDFEISTITNNNDNANRYQQLTRRYEPIRSIYDITQHEYILETDIQSSFLCQLQNNEISFIEIDGISLD